MDKTALRRQIREKKRAMTEQDICRRSERLGELFAASAAYQNAKMIYGYLPYNQEVRTVPMLERALKDGKQVAGESEAFIAADNIEYSVGNKIPLWTFGFLY